VTKLRTAVAVAAIGLLAGCGGGAEPSDEDGVALRVVIPDANIREPGSPCSGADGFRFAHAQAPYTVQDATGGEVAAGTLPEGSAEKAFTLDLGEARQPTVCVMMVEVPGVDTLDGHSLVIDGRSPVAIERNPSLDGIPEVVLR
jgi:hypothetical protein